jgi:hypothetical protein
MIYIIQGDYRSSDRFFEHSLEDIPTRYKKFIRAAADELGVVINDHWLNIMNHENHHTHLSKEEYKAKEKMWRKFLKSRSPYWFLKEHLKATEVKATWF